MPLYKITFTDNTVFLGGDTLEDSKWTEIPNKDILCLEYFLYSQNESIVLRNFEAYAAITEATQDPVTHVGDCPRCGGKAKLAKAQVNTGDRKFTKIVARCKNDKCKWVGKVEDAKNKPTNKKTPEYKYIMGLKNGEVTSYRIALEGIKGTDKYERGDVTKRKYPKGKEYRGKPIADWVWKKGIKA